MEKFTYHVVGNAPPRTGKIYDPIPKEVFDRCLSGLADFNEVKNLRIKLDSALADCSAFGDLLPKMLAEYLNANPRSSDISIRTQLVESFDRGLASFKKYVDHAIQLIDRRFGEESIAFAEFKAAISFEFDNNINYRLADKLRNYALHNDTALNHCVGSSSLEESGNVARAYSVGIDATILLEKYKKWGKNVTADLERYVSEGRPIINVDTMLGSAAESLKAIHRKAEALFRPHLLEAGKFISSTTAPALKEGFYPVLASRSPQVGANLTMTMHQVPIQMFVELGFVWNKIPKI